MQFPVVSRLPGRSIAIAALAAVPAALAAQESATTNQVPQDAAAKHVQLEEYVVSATRTPQDPNSTASSVTVIKSEDLAAAQIVTLRDALEQTPGVAVVRNGGVGSTTSVYLRGSNGDQTLFFVDGVPMNTRGAAYTSYLGSADLAGVDRIEVLRGPQSTLYGSSAIGGVITIDTIRGCGPLTGAVSATAGSFDTYGASATAQGGNETTGYAVALSRFETDNDRSANTFDQLGGSIRLETQATPALLVGTTYRGQTGDYEEPGSTLAPFAGTVDFENQLATVYAQLQPGNDFTSRLTLGLHDRDYVYTSAFGPSPVTNTRQLFEWQNTWDAADWLQLVAGVSAEHDKDTFAGSTYEDDRVAGYGALTVKPVENVSLTAGLRHDDYDSVGGSTTGRAGAAWYLPASKTKLRATYGTGFQAPSSADRYGVPAWFQPANLAVRPEESRGWDVGFDQALFGNRADLSVTYFRNNYKDLFSYDPGTFATINVGRATAEGVEVATSVKATDDVTLRAAYTWMEATNDTDDVPLIRRPGHVFDASAAWQATSRWLLGSGVHFAAKRYDGSTTAPVRVEDYTTVRLFTEYRFPKDITAKLRVENLLDENYAEVRGYPALPLAVYGSVEWRF